MGDRPAKLHMESTVHNPDQFLKSQKKPTRKLCFMAEDPVYVMENSETMKIDYSIMSSA